MTTPSGIRVEVKSSAYLQSWKQRRLSQITFTGLTGRAWSDDEAGRMAEGRTLRADVYVFAIHTCRDPDQYDPLDISSWEFRVLPAGVLRRHGYRSVTLSFLNREAPAFHSYAELAAAVGQAGALERNADQG